MNEQLKKRLIGAIVLVALAAIFIPMLFNGGEQTEIPTFGTNLPPKPDAQFQTIEVPLQLPAPEIADSRPIDSHEDAADYAAVPLSEPVAAMNDPEPAPPRPPAAKPTVRPGSVAGERPAAAPAVTAKAADSKPAKGWVVQLGSFGNASNALALRDKARKKGYAAFVEQQKIASGSIYRVRIGPEIRRDDADLLKARLEKAGFTGVVMPHP